MASVTSRLAGARWRQSRWACLRPDPANDWRTMCALWLSQSTCPCSASCSWSSLTYGRTCLEQDILNTGPRKQVTKLQLEKYKCQKIMVSCRLVRWRQVALHALAYVHGPPYRKSAWLRPWNVAMLIMNKNDVLDCLKRSFGSIFVIYCAD